MAAAVSGRFRALLIHSGSRRCALPLTNVVETLRPLPADPVPGMPAFVQGLAVIRGEPVPVVHLDRLLAQEEAGPPLRFVLLQVEQRRLALAVQRVYGLSSLDRSLLSSLPPLLRDARPEVLEAVGVLDRQLLLVLQAGRLLPEEVWQKLVGERLVS